MEDTIREVARDLAATFTQFGLKIVAAVIMLIVGWWIAKAVKRWIRERLGRMPHFDLTLAAFLASFASYAIMIITIIAVLHQFGVQTASLVAMLGAAGLAVGLALQGTLSNVAAGVMLLIFRPFRVGDFVDVQGASGTVKDMGLFITELTTADNIQVTVPNSQIWGNVVKNYSVNATRRMEVNVSIALGQDPDRAMAAIREVLAHDERILKDPAPQVIAMNLTPNAIELVVRAWAKASDFWPARFDLVKSIKQRLSAEGIEIHLPQRVVYMQAEADGNGATAPLQ